MAYAFTVDVCFAPESDTAVNWLSVLAPNVTTMLFAPVLGAASVHMEKFSPPAVYSTYFVIDVPAYVTPVGGEPPYPTTSIARNLFEPEPIVNDTVLVDDPVALDTDVELSIAIAIYLYCTTQKPLLRGFCGYNECVVQLLRGRSA